MVQKLIYSIPLFGWMLKSASLGDTAEKVFFIFNLLAFWAIAIYFFGYPAIILPALGIVGCYMLVLALLTSGDV